MVKNNGIVKIKYKYKLLDINSTDLRYTFTFQFKVLGKVVRFLKQPNLTLLTGPRSHNENLNIQRIL